MIKNLSNLSKNSITTDPLSEFIDSINLNITDFGRRYQKKNTDGNKQTLILDDYDFVYVIKGEIGIAVNDVQYNLQAGSYMILKPEDIYVSSQVSEENSEFFYIHFTISPAHLIDEFNELFVLNKPTPHAESLNYVENFLSRILNHKNIWKDGYATLIKLALTHFLIRIHYNKKTTIELSEKLTENNEAEIKLMHEAIQWMKQHIHEPIQIKKLVQHLNVSESKLYKTFITYMDLSPSKYNMKVKMKKARSMLLTSDLSISEVAESLGFNSQFHLSKVYKDYYHLTPSEYRKKFSK